MSCQGCPSAGNCHKDQSSCGVVESNPKNKIKHVVAVLSGKGGVGKSTISVLLAKSLAKQGKKVGIMDADITGPSIPRLMGLEDQHAYATNEDEILPVELDGIKMMSLNFLLQQESDPVIWRGPVITNVVTQFYKDVLWGDLDVLLIDMPPGTGDVALTIMQQLPVEGVLMVSTPQPMVSMIVEKAIKMCNQMEIPVLGVVENMAYLECPNCNETIDFYNEEELNDFISRTNVKLYGKLPMIDVIRDIAKYESYDLAQQQKTLDLMDDIATQVITDIE